MIYRKSSNKKKLHKKVYSKIKMNENKKRII